MRDHWVGENIDLDALAEHLKKFFEEKEFKVSLKKKPEEYKVVAAPEPGSELSDILEIIVRGKPDDFWVEFGTETDNARAFTRYGGLAYLIGGGFLLRKGLKSQEEFDKLERAFWSFVDEKLPSLKQQPENK